MRKLLIFTSLVEITLGIGLLVLPTLVINLLLGTDTDKSMEAICRLSGVAFMCFGFACFPSKDITNRSLAVRAMFTYNIFAGIYLVYLKFIAGFDGSLLVPGFILHITITIYFIFLIVKSKE